MNKELTIEEFILNSETVKIALVEAAHRYYYDHAWKNNNSESKRASDILSNLWCGIPDWRHRLKKISDRYTSNGSTDSLDIFSKPSQIILPKLSIDFSKPTQPC